MYRSPQPDQAAPTLLERSTPWKTSATYSKLHINFCRIKVRDVKRNLDQIPQYQSHLGLICVRISQRAFPLKFCYSQFSRKLVSARVLSVYSPLVAVDSTEFKADDLLKERQSSATGKNCRFSCITTKREVKLTILASTIISMLAVHCISFCSANDQDFWQRSVDIRQYSVDVKAHSCRLHLH